MFIYLSCSNIHCLSCKDLKMIFLYKLSKISIFILSISSTLAVYNQLICIKLQVAAWSSGMIFALGAKGHGFDPRCRPFLICIKPISIMKTHLKLAKKALLLYLLTLKSSQLYNNCFLPLIYKYN
jgi:hypothetical protein